MVKKYCLEALHEKKKIEALHEITDFVHEMLSVCAPELFKEMAVGSPE